MKRVTNITIGNVVFAIEEDAYEALSQYLASISKAFKGSDDYVEIAADIEGAIAEKFLKSKKNERHAVSKADVVTVISEMGSAADLSREMDTEMNEDESPKAEEDNKGTASPTEAKRRLYRDSEDAIIGGVASGLAQYFGIDPVIVRTLFVVSIFINGFGLLAYLILWLVVPAATTTEERYAMRGNAVTVKEITQRVKKDFNNIKDKNSTAPMGLWGRLRPFLVKLFSIAGLLVQAFLRLARYVVGGVFVFGGAVGSAALVSAYSVVLLSERILLPMEAQIAVDTMLQSALGVVAIIASFVMMLVPLLVLLIAGASLLSRRNFFTVPQTIILIMVWITAATLSGTASVLQVEVVMQEFERQGIESGEFQIHVGDNHFEADIDFKAPAEEGAAQGSLPTDIIEDGPALDTVACTADAMECPDGSFIGRTGPGCEFICTTGKLEVN